MTNKLSTIVFDIDGILLNTKESMLKSLQATLLEFTNRTILIEQLQMYMEKPIEDILNRFEVVNIPEAVAFWHEKYQKEYANLVEYIDGMPRLLLDLKRKGYDLGVVALRTHKALENDFYALGITHLLNVVMFVDDALRPLPNPDPLRNYLRLSNKCADEVVFIGDSHYALESAHQAGMRFGVAQWATNRDARIMADYVFKAPKDVYDKLIA